MGVVQRRAPRFRVNRSGDGRPGPASNNYILFIFNWLSKNTHFLVWQQACWC